MSDDLTRKMPGSFEERVFAEFAAMRQGFAQLNTRMDSLEARMSSLENRVATVDARLIALEDKVDARLRETRPIWEGVQQRLTGIERSLDKLSRHFKVFVNDAFDLRAWVEKLEDEHAAREG
jgi:chromosome segregation ATPase